MTLYAVIVVLQLVPIVIILVIVLTMGRRDEG